MTAIAGCVGGGEAGDRAARCQAIAADLLPFGASPRQEDYPAGASFSSLIRLSTPEDRFDKQPFVGHDGRLLFACDCRIDDRAGLGGRLAISGPALTSTSDSELLFRSWARWGAAGLSRIDGDFACAAWNSAERRLQLARSPGSHKPLYYAVSGSVILFASMPLSVSLATGSERRIDLENLAIFASNGSFEPGATIYSGVSRVEPGTVVTWQEGQVRTERFWTLSLPEPRRERVSQLAEEYEELLTSAVSARLRRASGTLACELSGGRDSSAVAAIAGRLMGARGEDVLALTHAPREGYTMPGIYGRVADESPIAAATAGLHPALRHRIIRSAPRASLADLSDCEWASQHPIQHPSNMIWFRQILSTAKEAGASVLLSGASGNFTISAGGLPALSHLLGEQGLSAWLREARKGGVLHPRRVPFLVNSLSAALLPTGFHQSLLRAADRARFAPEQLRLLRQPYRAVAEQAATRWKQGFSARYGLVRQDALQRLDLGGMMSIGMASIEERDPTADRRLIEFCLSLPAEALVDGRLGRPIYDRVFAGKVDSRVLRPRLRGLQGADWHEQFDVSNLRDNLERSAGDPDFRELFDIVEIHRQLDRWPTSDWHHPRNDHQFRNRLLSALSIGHFLQGVRERLTP